MGLMDEVAARQMPVPAYVVFCDRLDATPAFASKQPPELNLRDGLADAGNSDKPLRPPAAPCPRTRQSQCALRRAARTSRAG